MADAANVDSIDDQKKPHCAQKESGASSSRHADIQLDGDPGRRMVFEVG